MRKPGQFAGEPLLLPIDIDPEPTEERLTAWGGAALLVQGDALAGPAGEHATSRPHQTAAAREDPGIAEVLGYAVPSPEAARKFLNHFHDESMLEQAQQKSLALGQASAIPGENAPLQGWRRSTGM